VTGIVRSTSLGRSGDVAYERDEESQGKRRRRRRRRGRETERAQRVRINRKLWRAFMPAELFIDDATYARIFPRRAARRVSDYKTLHFRPSSKCYLLGRRYVCRFAEDINTRIYGQLRALNCKSDNSRICGFTLTLCREISPDDRREREHLHERYFVVDNYHVDYQITIVSKNADAPSIIPLSSC